MSKKEYLSLEKLKVYQLARELSRIAWEIYEGLSWQDKKITGNQFIESTDSVSANVAEGFGRFHYLDKVKFYFNSRGSLLESRNWAELLRERDKITTGLYERYLNCYKNLKLTLSGLIQSTMKEKKKK